MGIPRRAPTASYFLFHAEGKGHHDDNVGWGCVTIQGWGTLEKRGPQRGVTRGNIQEKARKM